MTQPPTQSQPGAQVVWFKRDLRCHDHAPLCQAAMTGPVLPLYVVEKEYWQQPDTSLRHWLFVRESLQELHAALAALGAPLVVRHGDVITTLERIRETIGIAGLWSHEETGNDWTFQRDRSVGRWCEAHGIPWTEQPQHAVVRRLNSRDHWDQHWKQRMQAPPVPPPASLNAIAEEQLVLPETLGSDQRPCPQRQPGGRSRALKVLDSFFSSRGRDYRGAMSSPEQGARACSRLSPHLAWGTVSLREVLHRLWEQQAQVTDPRWKQSLKSFESRLHWHCHFIQKLEDEPAIEFRNMHPGLNGLRDEEADPQRLQAWAEGQTGFPFVDACMRSLHATGWLNFRMRAMLMAFSSYHLWLHWREPALHLARLFTDYEPGIHYSQAQMQSGTTGINTLRIYNPVKQSRDQDPDGRFIRRWVPELANVPDDWIHEPWRMPRTMQSARGVIIGEDYPAPVVDHEQAAREARQKITAFRRAQGFQDTSKRVMHRHGSRKRSARRTRRKPVADRQFDLGL